jgi:hypothetical protein
MDFVDFVVTTTIAALAYVIKLFYPHIVLDAILVAIAKDVWAIGRILFTIVVMYFVLQGRKWAKWVLVGIFSFLVVALIALVIALYSKLSTILIVGSLILTVLSTIVVIYLSFSKDLNRYFSYKRQNSVE